MKLRFHGNTLRLRLTQPEVVSLKQTGRVQEIVTFAPGRTLVYSLETVPAGEIAASFEDGHIRVLVPAAAAGWWIDSDQVGMEHCGPPLHILIEKDFQCLHHSAEEEPGAFPHPLAK